MATLGYNTVFRQVITNIKAYYCNDTVTDNDSVRRCGTNLVEDNTIAVIEKDGWAFLEI